MRDETEKKFELKKKQSKKNDKVKEKMMMCAYDIFKKIFIFSYMIYIQGQ